MYMGYINLLGFKVILGSFSALVSKWPVTGIWHIFDILVFKGMFGVIQCTCPTMICDSKTASSRAKQ